MATTPIKAVDEASINKFKLSHCIVCAKNTSTSSVLSSLNAS